MFRSIVGVICIGSCCSVCIVEVDNCFTLVCGWLTYLLLYSIGVSMVIPLCLP